jgi:hypothetical protein
MEQSRSSCGGPASSKKPRNREFVNSMSVSRKRESLSRLSAARPAEQCESQGSLGKPWLVDGVDLA